MNNSQTIRVLVVDDHEMVRKGLGLFLDGFDDLELAGEADNGRVAVTLCEQLRPDVVLMDLIMPEGDGVPAILEINQRMPWIKLIALTSFRDEQLIAMALRAGAVGFLYKDIGTDELANAIRNAYHGRYTLSPDATQYVLQRIRDQDTTHSLNLTQREQQVLMMMVQGLPNRQIALQMHVTLAMVKQYSTSLFDKLGVSSRMEAVSQALKFHIIDPEQLQHHSTLNAEQHLFQ